MTETQYINKILRPFLKELGFKKIHKSSERFKSGWPDLTCVHAPTGRVAFIEAKVGKNCPTPLQMAEMTELAQSRAEVYVMVWIDKVMQKILQVAPNGALVDVDPRNFIRRYSHD